MKNLIQRFTEGTWPESIDLIEEDLKKSNWKELTELSKIIELKLKTLNRSYYVYKDNKRLVDANKYHETEKYKDALGRLFASISQEIRRKKKLGEYKKPFYPALMQAMDELLTPETKTLILNRVKEIRNN